MITKNQRVILDVLSKLGPLELNQTKIMFDIVARKKLSDNEGKFTLPVSMSPEWNIQYLEKGGFIEFMSNGRLVGLKYEDSNGSEDVRKAFWVLLFFLGSIENYNIAKADTPSQIAFINDKNEYCEILYIKKENISRLGMITKTDRNEDVTYILTMEKSLFKDPVFKAQKLDKILSKINNVYIALLSRNKEGDVDVEFVCG